MLIPELSKYIMQNKVLTFTEENQCHLKAHRVIHQLLSYSRAISEVMYSLRRNEVNLKKPNVGKNEF